MNYQHLKEDYLKMGKNFMTPNIEKYTITTNGRIVELSTGTGVEGEKIWGVTELERIDGRLETTRQSGMFTTLKEANKHYKLLENK